MFSALQRQIAHAVLDGVDLEKIEAEIIDVAPIGEDQRAALWLYADALTERRGKAILEDEVALIR